MSNIGKLQKQRKYREIHRFTRRDNFSSLSCATLLLSFQHVAIVGAFMEYVDKGFIRRGASEASEATITLQMAVPKSQFWSKKLKMGALGI